MTAVAKYMAIGEETTWKTAVAAVEYGDFIEESMEGKHRFIDHQGVARSTQKDRQIGSSWSEGNVQFPVLPDKIIGYMLKWLLGAPSSAQQGATTAYLHTYTEDDTLKPFTLRIGKYTNEHIFPGCVMGGLELAASVNNFLVATARMIGAFEDTKGSKSAPTFGSQRFFRLVDCTFEVDDSDKSTSLRAATVDIDNGITIDDWLAAGDAEPVTQPLHTARKIGGTLDLRGLDGDIETDFLAGTDAKVELIYETDVIEGAYNYKLAVTLPHVVYDQLSHHVRERDTEMSSVPFTALYDATATYAIQVELQNTKTSY